jgi:hypothetical protein
MYKSNFTCTYSFYDPFLRDCYHKEDKFDLEDVEEFADMSELVYQAELLQVLNIAANPLYSGNVEFNTEQILELYNQIKQDAKFIECVEKAQQHHSCEDLEIAFMILFSYDYFFLTHRCLSEFLNTGNISDANINCLKSAIK